MSLKNALMTTKKKNHKQMPFEIVIIDPEHKGFT